MAKLVSKVYGDALFEAARDCGKMDEIFEEVQSIGVILEENAELQKILGNPRVMREDKEQMIETIFRGRVSIFYRTCKRRKENRDCIYRYSSRTERGTERSSHAAASSDDKI